VYTLRKGIRNKYQEDVGANSNTSGYYLSANTFNGWSLLLCVVLFRGVFCYVMLCCVCVCVVWCCPTLTLLAFRDQQEDEEDGEPRPVSEVGAHGGGRLHLFLLGNSNTAIGHPK